MGNLVLPSIDFNPLQWLTLILLLWKCWCARKEPSPFLKELCGNLLMCWLKLMPSDVVPCGNATTCMSHILAVDALGISFVRP